MDDLEPTADELEQEQEIVYDEFDDGVSDYEYSAIDDRWDTGVPLWSAFA